MYLKKKKRNTVPFPCPPVLFLYTVAWWVSATPLQLHPTPSPPRPIHPALQPTQRTHSDVNFSWKGGGCGGPATYRGLPSTPPPRILASLLLLASSLPRSLLFSSSSLWGSCDAPDKSYTHRVLRKCHSSVTPTHPHHHSQSFSPHIAPHLLPFPLQTSVVSHFADCWSSAVRGGRRRLLWLTASSSSKAIKYSLSGEVCGPLSVCLLSALLIPGQN